MAAISLIKRLIYSYATLLLPTPPTPKCPRIDYIYAVLKRRGVGPLAKKSPSKKSPSIYTYLPVWETLWWLHRYTTTALTFLSYYYYCIVVFGLAGRCIPSALAPFFPHCPPSLYILYILLGNTAAYFVLFCSSTQSLLIYITYILDGYREILLGHHRRRPFSSLPPLLLYSCDILARHRRKIFIYIFLLKKDISLVACY